MNAAISVSAAKELAGKLRQIIPLILEARESAIDAKALSEVIAAPPHSLNPSPKALRDLLWSMAKAKAIKTTKAANGGNLYSAAKKSGAHMTQAERAAAKERNDAIRATIVELIDASDQSYTISQLKQTLPLLSPPVNLAENNLRSLLVGMLKHKAIASTKRGNTLYFHSLASAIADTDGKYDGQAKLAAILAIVKDGRAAANVIADRLGENVAATRYWLDKFAAAGALKAINTSKGAGSGARYVYAKPDSDESAAGAAVANEVMDAQPATSSPKPSIDNPYPFPPGTPPAPAQPAIVISQSVIDAFVQSLAPVIDGLVVSLAKPIAQYAAASLQQHVTQELSNAISNMKLPGAATPAPDTQIRKPRVCVVGLIPAWAGQIQTEYGSRIKFKFIETNHVGRAATDGAQHADVCLAMTGHISHKIVEGLTRAGAKVEWVNGGMTSLRQRLTQLAPQPVATH